MSKLIRKNDASIQKKDRSVSALDAAIFRAAPELKELEVATVRSRIIQYVADGLDSGFDIALIKTSEHSDEINLKVLRIRDEKK